jgi:lipopolysaccharide/colanic/teichoic acid biosynthesis glycosyltransferase
MIGISQGPLSSVPILSTPRVSARRARTLRSGPFGEERPAWSHQLIDQELFRDAVVRERKRADRFEEAFVLVLISLNSRAARLPRWRQLVERLSQSTLDPDVIGWFERDSVLGLVRSLADRDPKETVASLTDTIRGELVRCLTPDNVDCCAIRLELYSPHSDSIPPLFFDAPDTFFDGDKPRRTIREVARDAAKRLLDIIVSAIFLIILSPLFLFLSALVKLTSKGPVFFRQQRVGEAGRPFIMLKFRTMQLNADHRIHQQYIEKYIQSNETSQPGKNVVFKMLDDPRVTRLGHFLRKSSLDEFPQFWNVLRGEMSLVGPRPPLAYEVARYKRWHRRRVLEVKPGITGLWQVTGRSRTTFDEMVRMDIQYAKSYSLWTDLKILLATPRAVLSGNGAH